MLARGRTLAASILLVAVACTGGSAGVGQSPLPPPTAPPSLPEAEAAAFFQRQACGLPARQLERIWHGYYEPRSGNIQIVPKEPNTVGNWFSHSGPWPYLQNVPLFFYGPGHVPAVGSVQRPVTVADLAPTLAGFTGFDFDAADGKPLREALSEEASPPRLIVTMVWDSAGDNVLNLHSDAWPNMKGLIPQGVWYENATDGTSPSISGPMHATIGTGAYPSTHGTVDHWFLLDGDMVQTETLAPTGALLVPTLADLYDRALDNAPVIAAIGPNGWHLAMAGHGSLFEGGDKDIGVGLTDEGWKQNRPNATYFSFPAYLRDVPVPEADARELDLEDGTEDDAWNGDEFIVERLREADWQTAGLREMIRRQGFGADDITDLLYVNYKQVDEVGHFETMNSDAMGIAVGSNDDALADLIDILNEEVGQGQWVIAVVAEHGATPNLEVSGGFQIDEQELRDDIIRTFDGDGDDNIVLLQQRPSQVWIDPQELAEKGFTLDQVARFLVRYTEADNVKDPSQLPEEERDDRVFSSVFPSEIMADLPCLETG